MKSFKNLMILFLMIGIISGCHVYSFTGASISPDIKTVSIQLFPNRASIVQPSLSQAFTEKLKDKFVSETSLALVKDNGDLNFEGAITDYNTQPTAITGNDNAALNRLTITVSVKFTNTKDSKQDFETNFSRYADYDSRKSLSSVEQELITQINSQLVDDIFNKAVVNW
jgi:outer membrane lipopolysaccharide assembly protein LptE/RlpB